MVGISYAGCGALVSLLEVIIWCQISCQCEPLHKCLLMDRHYMGNMSNPKSDDVVRSHMSYSPKNKATNWYDSEFTSLEKEALRVLPLEQRAYRTMEAIPPYTHHHYQEAPDQGDSQAAASRSLN